MPEVSRKRCLVAIDAAGGPLLIEVELGCDATIDSALALARAAARPRGLPCDIDWDGAAVGVWGQRCERAAVPLDGDRIEVYRPLPADPRERRRRRAARR
jgi:putative ubiquitin-RnfH superfamily antitoxin RatB of RatAB toxin-antitoxin module